LSWSKIPYRRYSCGLTRRGKGAFTAAAGFRRAASLPAPGRNDGTGRPSEPVRRCAPPAHAARPNASCPRVPLRSSPHSWSTSCRTHRWRETDSNHRSLSRESRFILRKVNWGIDGAAKKILRGYRWFESISLQRRVKCEPDFRGEQPRAIRFRAASPPRAVSGRPAPISRIYTPIHMEFLCQYLEI
jgi:hypothetical protein